MGDGDAIAVLVGQCVVAGDSAWLLCVGLSDKMLHVQSELRGLHLRRDIQG